MHLKSRTLTPLVIDMPPINVKCFGVTRDPIYSEYLLTIALKFISPHSGINSENKVHCLPERIKSTFQKNFSGEIQQKSSKYSKE